MMGREIGFPPLILLCVAGLLACHSGEAGSAIPPEQKLSPRLRGSWSADSQSAAVRQRVLIDLATQVDLAQLADSLRRSGADRHTRRRIVLERLRQTAERSQARVKPLLERLQQRGEIDGYRSVVIVNRLIANATPVAIRALAEQREVVAITEETVAWPSVLSAGPAASAAIDSTSWALDAVGAPAAWRQGLDGRGVVVGLIDAGASATHEQLRQNYRGGERSWHNPVDPTPSPLDILVGHGTGVLSAAVGGGAGGRKIGVAPGAQWIACVGLPGGRYSNVALTECADWMLTIGQPDVLINPWQLPNAGCDRSLERIVAAWRAAEILPVFAAGNHGPTEGTDRSPANYALSVGAIQRQGTLLPRSSRGPNSCDGSIYPSLVAPGAGVPVAFPLTASSYIRTDGTSVAAGLVAGVAALLLQHDAEATVKQLEDALRTGAADLGPPGPDNGYGYGRVSVPAALTALDRSGAHVQANSSSVSPAHR